MLIGYARVSTQDGLLTLSGRKCMLVRFSLRIYDEANLKNGIFCHRTTKNVRNKQFLTFREAFWAR